MQISISWRRVLSSTSLLLAGGVAGALVAAPAEAAPKPGQFCSPHGAVYKTATSTLLCAQTKTDARFRWRSISVAGPKGPAGPRGARGVPGPAGPAAACAAPYAVRTVTLNPERHAVKVCASALPGPTTPATAPRPTTTSQAPTTTSPPTTPTQTGTGTATGTPTGGVGG